MSASPLPRRRMRRENTDEKSAAPEGTALIYVALVRASALGPREVSVALLHRRTETGAVAANGLCTRCAKARASRRAVVRIGLVEKSLHTPPGQTIRFPLAGFGSMRLQSGRRSQIKDKYNTLRERQRDRAECLLRALSSATGQRGTSGHPLAPTGCRASPSRSPSSVFIR